MSEQRPPEAMPTNWMVASFEHDKGIGTLRHEGGEEVVFDAQTWNVGDWKAPRNIPDQGAASPYLPQPGEPVRVEWRRSRTGKNVPRLVQPTGRVSAPRRGYKLSAWLAAVQRHTGRFANLTAAGLVKALARLDEDLAEEWRGGEPREASDFGNLLMAIAHLAADEPDWRATHADWIHADDHRWDRERACARLPAMLGLPPNSVPTAGDGYTTGGDQSLSEYADACNAQAAAAGIELRLHGVDADEHVLVCLPPAAFAALVEAGYLARAE